MRTLFISDIAENFSAGGFEPLGIMYVAAPLIRAGHEVAITGTRLDRTLPAVERFRPDVCAYSTTTGLHHLYLRVNAEVKKRFEVFSVFGGPHPTFFPQLIEDQGVDAICRGEGEKALKDLVEALSRDGSPLGISNLWLKRGGAIHKNDVRHLVEDLDLIDFPARRFFYETYPHAGRSKMKTFIASRGCPYRCTYCFNHAFNKLYRGKGRIVRFRSVENLIGEIDEVRKLYPLELVMFHDSSFLFDDGWLEEFASKYPRRIGLPFNCNVRPDHVTEERVRNLKRAGCYSVVWAAEAGNDYIRNTILKRNIDKERMLLTSNLLHRHKVNFEIQNIIGIPGEGLEEALETLRFNIECRPSWTQASLLFPYPGTEIYETAEGMGLLEPGAAIRNETFYEHSPLKLPRKRELENLQKLFSVTVEFPRIFRLIRFLIRLPLGGAYNFIRKLHKGYCVKFRILYYRTGVWESLSLAYRYLTGKAS
jgi:radical SAM superfamily enzyme YgiQ (UPF0313 family)